MTLHGNVGSYTEKTTAERVALHVFGVRGVANDLTVHLPSASEQTDTDTASCACPDSRCHEISHSVRRTPGNH